MNNFADALYQGLTNACYGFEYYIAIKTWVVYFYLKKKGITVDKATKVWFGFLMMVFLFNTVTLMGSFNFLGGKTTPYPTYHLYTIAENILVLLYCINFQYKEHRKWSYITMFTFLMFSMAMKFIFFIEPLNMFDLVSAPMSCFILFLFILRALRTLNEESPLDVKDDHHFYIMAAYVIFFSGETFVFLLNKTFPDLLFFHLVLIIGRDVLFLRALNILKRSNPKEDHKWMDTL